MTAITKQTPPGYKVVAFCPSCGRDFAGDHYFVRHRLGTHEYTLSEGLAMDPPREDGRRCGSDEELHERGLRAMTEEEQLAGRHASRAGYGIEMWTDPEHSAKFAAAKTAQRLARGQGGDGSDQDDSEEGEEE